MKITLSSQYTFNKKYVFFSTAPKTIRNIQFNNMLPVLNIPITNHIVPFCGDKKVCSITPISDKSLLEIVKQNNKKPVVFSDFDGTIYPLYINESPENLIKRDEFQQINKGAKIKNIPFFILTARGLSQFTDINKENILNFDLNILSLNGNEMLVTLPNNNKTKKYLSCLQKDKKFDVSFVEDDDNIKIFSTPVVSEDFQKGAKVIKSIFEPLGFVVEDKNVHVALRWRKLEKKIREANNNNQSYNIFIDDDLYAFLLFDNNLKKSSSNNNVTIYNKKLQERFFVSLDNFINYAIFKFSNVYSNELSKNYLREKNIELRIYKNDKKTIEIKLLDYFKIDKNNSLSIIFNLYDTEKSYPVFLGDSLGPKSDELAIKEANSLGGIGVGILARFSDELQNYQGKPSERTAELQKRLLLNTNSKYLLTSYRDVIPFLTALFNQ